MLMGQRATKEAKKVCCGAVDLGAEGVGVRRCLCDCVTRATVLQHPWGGGAGGGRGSVVLLGPYQGEGSEPDSWAAQHHAYHLLQPACSPCRFHCSR